MWPASPDVIRSSSSSGWSSSGLPISGEVSRAGTAARSRVRLRQPRGCPLPARRDRASGENGGLRHGARGPGTIAWTLHRARIEEDLFHRLMAPPPPQGAGSVWRALVPRRASSARRLPSGTKRLWHKPAVVGSVLWMCTHWCRCRRPSSGQGRIGGTGSTGPRWRPPPTGSSGSRSVVATCPPADVRNRRRPGRGPKRVGGPGSRDGGLR